MARVDGGGGRLGAEVCEARALARWLHSVRTSGACKRHMAQGRVPQHSAARPLSPPAPAEMWSATRHCSTETPGLAIVTSMLCMAPGIMPTAAPRCPSVSIVWPSKLGVCRSTARGGSVVCVCGCVCGGCGVCGVCVGGVCVGGGGGGGGGGGWGGGGGGGTRGQCACSEVLSSRAPDLKVPTPDPPASPSVPRDMGVARAHLPSPSRSPSRPP